MVSFEQIKNKMEGNSIASSGEFSIEYSLKYKNVSNDLSEET